MNRPSRARLRAGVNWVNGSTLLGLGIARVGSAHLHRDDQRLWHASGYAGPHASRVFTVGNVILHRHGPDYLHHRPGLLAHERVHSTQWACLGPLFLPLYYSEALISWGVTGDFANANAFEMGAGLRRGGYRLPALQRRRRPLRLRFTRVPWTASPRKPHLPRVASHGR